MKLLQLLHMLCTKYVDFCSLCFGTEPGSSTKVLQPYNRTHTYTYISSTDTGCSQEPAFKALHNVISVSIGALDVKVIERLASQETMRCLSPGEVPGKRGLGFYHGSFLPALCQSVCESVQISQSLSVNQSVRCQLHSTHTHIHTHTPQKQEQEIPATLGTEAG